MTQGEMLLEIADLQNQVNELAKQGHLSGRARRLLRRYHVTAVKFANLEVSAVDEAIRPQASMEEVQRRAAYHAYMVAGGNMSAAARALNISRSTFYRRYRRFLPKN